MNFLKGSVELGFIEDVQGLLLALRCMNAFQMLF